uniref:Uncharacterized protein n=1 Tax=viral metagenome TaxID=1070528 RepID=A0A6C0JXW0_9ZZZZ
MPWTPARPWIPIAQYRTFPLPILPILAPIPYKPYKKGSAKKEMPGNTPIVSK